MAYVKEISAHVEDFQNIRVAELDGRGQYLRVCTGQENISPTRQLSKNSTESMVPFMWGHQPLTEKSDSFGSAFFHRGRDFP